MGWREELIQLQKFGYSLWAKKYFLDRSTTSKDLSTGALSYTTSIADKFKLHQVLASASVGLNDTTITVTFDSLTGANYDTDIGAVDFDGSDSVVLLAGDNLLGVIGDS